MINMELLHPGMVLYEEYIKPLGLSLAEAARHLGVSLDTLAGFIDMKRRCTPELAMHIAIATGTGVSK